MGRKAQIVCTIGPASGDPDTLAKLIDAGMSVARLNFAHGGEAQHRETFARIRATSSAAERPVAVLLDLAGPKLRLGELAGGPVALAAGEAVELRCDLERVDRAGVLPLRDAYLAAEVGPGDTLLIGDGAVELTVDAVEPPAIRCRVTSAGRVAGGKGVNVPGGLPARPILSEADRRALEIAGELGADLVGVSYVRRAEDLTAVRRALRALGRPIPLVAKIETALALDHLDAILARTDAVMIARGDLSLEIPFERVPIEQKRIVEAALRAGRPVITATQMLQSMVSSPRPTRAEATDVANAVLDGTDAVMLSDETAVGTDPVRACRAMARIIEATEAALPSREVPPAHGLAGELRELVVFSQAAVRTARELGVRAIVSWTRGGLAARLLARERPSVPILAPTRFEDSWRRLALVYGVRPVLCPRSRLTLGQLARELGPVEERDLLLVVRHRPGEHRRIPWMGLVRVADTEGWATDPRDGGAP